MTALSGQRPVVARGGLQQSTWQTRQEVNFGIRRRHPLSLFSLTNGLVHLRFAGSNDVTRWLQASTDLVQWETILTNSPGPEQCWELWLPVAGQGVQFFRVVTP